MREAGIYAITNTVTGDQYVGSAVNLKERAKQHWRQVLLGKHHNKPLSRVVKKYGIDKFKFEILHLCDPHECKMYEQIFMDMLKPKYNTAPVAVSCLGVKHTDESKAKMSKFQKFYSSTKEGRENRRKGGLAAAAKMTPEQRSERSRKGGRKGGLIGAPILNSKLTPAQLSNRNKKTNCSRWHKDHSKICGLCDQCWEAMDPAALAKFMAVEWRREFGGFREMFPGRAELMAASDRRGE